MISKITSKEIIDLQQEIALREANIGNLLNEIDEIFNKAILSVKKEILDIELKKRASTIGVK